MLASLIGLSHMAGELLLAARVSPASFESYVTLRTHVMLLALIAVFGFDGVIIRQGSASARGMHPLVLQGAALVVLITGALALAAPVWRGPPLFAASALIPAALIAGCALIAADLRRRGQLARAAVVRDGWRLLPLMLFVATLVPMAASFTIPGRYALVMVAATLLVALLALVGASWRSAPEASAPDAPAPQASWRPLSARAALGLGAGFAAANLSLFIAIFGDQLALTHVATAETVGALRSYALVAGAFIYPASLLSATLGVVLTPSFVDRAHAHGDAGQHVIADVRTRLGALLTPGRAVLAAVALALYCTVFAVAFRVVEVSAPITLWAAFLCTALVRVVHGFSSSLVGAFLPARELLLLALAMLLIASMQYVLALRFAAAASLAALAWLTCAGWIVRAGLTALAVRRHATARVTPQLQGA